MVLSRQRHQLKALRNQRGLTQRDIAATLRVGEETYASWERGTATPRVGFRPALARILGLTLPELDVLLADGTPAPGGHAVTNSHTVPEWLDTYASLEQAATRVWAFEPLVVPGLLQTREYAHAIEASDPISRSPEDVAKRVELRIVRQGVLWREPEPLSFFVVLDEAALCRLAGSREVMARQLEHLVDVADNENVEVRVLPFDAQVFAAVFGSFSLMSSSAVQRPTMAFTVNRTGVSYLSRPFEIDAHMSLFEHLWASALGPNDSAELIRHIAKERYQ